MHSSSRPRILVLQTALPEEIEAFSAFGELVIDYPGLRDPANADAGILAQIDIVITNGIAGFSRAMFDACPKLRLIHCFSVGHEAIDLAEAAQRNIPVTGCHGANADIVADQAMALALAVLRSVPRYDREIRAGTWKASRTQPQFTGKKVGILGMGPIGQEIARRASAFKTRIFYTARSSKPALPWQYCPSVEALAAEVDILFVACPGDQSTFHLVDGGVLAALGQKGILVNISRGQVVDTAALRDALVNRLIGGAGLDVIEGEPLVPDWIREVDNLVLSPHVAGASPESRRAMLDAALASLAAYPRGAHLLISLLGPGSRRS